MSSPNYPQNLPYCLPSDVTSLLGSLTFTTSASGSEFISKAIQSCQQKFETITNRRFSPTYHVECSDGTGYPSMILQHYPVIKLVSLQNYITPEFLTVNFFDYQLTIDRTYGIIRVPLTYITSAAMQFTQSFYRGNKNLQVKYWTGYTSDLFGETLTTIDNTSYSFLNKTLAQVAVNQFGPVQNTPPVYTPIVYKNGVQLINTTYTWVSNFNGSAYNVVEDDIFYTVDWVNGKIVFNQPNSPSDVITADYSYWFIPYDVSLAVAKLAAIEVLKTEMVGTGGTLGQGTSSFQVGDYKAVYGKENAYPFEGQINSLRSDVDEIVKVYRRAGPEMTGGFVGSLWS